MDNPNGGEARRRAYAAGAPMSKERMAQEAPLDAAALAVVQVRRFVEAGGSLFTTDWALRHVIEPTFPGMIAFNERPTADDVVRVEIRDHDNPFLTGVMDGSDDPQWWLDGSSYPIRVLDPRVSVLITSREMGDKYGEAAIAVTFPWGAGEVFHMVSHYYLQRTTRHGAKAAAYAAEKGVFLPPPMLDGLSLGDVESAQTSSRMLANLVAQKKKRAIRPREGD